MSVAVRAPKQALTLTALYYLSFIFLGLSHSSIGPTLPYLAENTGVTLQAVSVLFVARSFGYLLGALFGSRLYDRFKGHTLFVIALIGIGSSLGLIPLATTLWLLVGVMLLLGAFESTLDVGANTLLVWVHRERVAPYMNGLHFAFGIGAFLLPIIVAQAILRGGSAAWAYGLMAVLTVPLALSFLGAASPPDEVSEEEAAGGTQKTGLVLLIAVFFFLYAGVEIAFGNWLYSYATTLAITSEAGAAYLTSAFWGAFTLGRLLTIPLAMRLKPSRLLWLCIGGAALSLVPMLVFPEARSALWVGSMGLGLSIAAVFPGMISFAERRVNIRGRVMGYFFIGVSLGAMSIPWFIGQVFERVHPYSMLVVVSVSLALAALVLAVILKRAPVATKL